MVWIVNVAQLAPGSELITCTNNLAPNPTNAAAMVKKCRFGSLVLGLCGSAMLTLNGRGSAQAHRWTHLHQIWLPPATAASTPWGSGKSSHQLVALGFSEKNTDMGNSQVNIWPMCFEASETNFGDILGLNHEVSRRLQVEIGNPKNVTNRWLVARNDHNVWVP